MIFASRMRARRRIWMWRGSSPAPSRSATEPAAPPAPTNLIAFRRMDPHAIRRRRNFCRYFPTYSEPTVTKAASPDAPAGPVLEKLNMYVAQARFILDRPPGAFNLARYVTLPFLEKIDPAIKHKLIAAADINPLTDLQGTGNDNPHRKWCTGRTTLICISVELQARRQDSDRHHAGQQIARHRQEGVRPHRFRRRAVGACVRRSRSGWIEAVHRRSMRRSPACSSRTFSTSIRS